MMDAAAQPTQSLYSAASTDDASSTASSTATATAADADGSSSSSLSRRNQILHQPYNAKPVPKSFILGLFVWWMFFINATSLAVHSAFPQVPWWMVTGGWYMTNILAVITHWIGHVRLEGKYLGWWYRAHIGHHINDYPPTKFISETYENAKEDNSQAYIGAIILSPLILLQFTDDRSLATVLTAILTGMIELKLADIMHMGFHQRDFWMEGRTFGIFEKLRDMHYYHHKGTMKHNYAVADFWLDFLFVGIEFNWDAPASHDTHLEHSAALAASASKLKAS